MDKCGNETWKYGFSFSTQRVQGFVVNPGLFLSFDNFCGHKSLPSGQTVCQSLI